jgi:hypothetical protein
MKIYPSENASGQVAGYRLYEKTAARGGPGNRREPVPQAADQPIPEIRKQLLVVQRSLGRYQSILGGFEGFKVLLDSGAREAADYIRHVIYRGEAVLEPYRAELNRILQTKDRPALQQLINGARTEIQGLAVELSRLETAEQNSRSLVLSAGALPDILKGIRSEGDQLFRLDGKNVLDLLG